MGPPQGFFTATDNVFNPYASWTATFNWTIPMDLPYSPTRIDDMSLQLVCVGPHLSSGEWLYVRLPLLAECTNTRIAIFRGCLVRSRLTASREPSLGRCLLDSPTSSPSPTISWSYSRLIVLHFFIGWPLHGCCSSIPPRDY